MRIGVGLVTVRGGGLLEVRTSLNFPFRTSGSGSGGGSQSQARIREEDVSPRGFTTDENQIRNIRPTIDVVPWDSGLSIRMGPKKAVEKRQARLWKSHHITAWLRGRTGGTGGAEKT